MDDTSVLHDAVVYGLTLSLVLSVFMSVGLASPSDAHVSISHQSTAIVHRVQRAPVGTADRSDRTHSLPATSAFGIGVVALATAIATRRFRAPVVFRDLVVAPRGPPAAAALAH